MNRITFTGAGCNAASLLTAIANAMNSPSKDTLPAGATWPFVTLSLDKQSVDFHMLYIKKSARPRDTEVRLSKLGYLYFQTPNHDNDFGFLTVKLSTLVKELRDRGYRLDKSCERNMLTARTTIVVTTALALAVVVLVTTMAILKPNGV